MCRIAGFIDFNYKNDYELQGTITSMRDVLSYGGPDGAGFYIEKEKGLALGHRRLSILDLSELGHQPMSNEDGSLWITYNGEVYNFKEIREELEKLGYKFKSNTDTEVVLKAFEHWGIQAVHKFRGMWAFALWDKEKEKLILCRDRVGVKPLYWYYHNNLFLFASELKAFHKHPKFRKELDRKALSLYLQYGYIGAPHSIFKYTYKLEPGYYLEIDREGYISTHSYWKIEDHYLNGRHEDNGRQSYSEDEITRELEGILRDSFKLRMVSDVPVGIFLSGGIDSSLLTALLQKDSTRPLKTFTIGFFEKDFNEAVWAKKIAQHLGTDHTEFYCTPKEAIQVIPKLAEIYDEPFGDSSAIPTYMVSQLAKQQVKASLSADGGDEIFCGYPKYWIFDRHFQKLNRIPFSFRKLASTFLNKINPNDVASAYDSMRIFLPKSVNIRDKFIKLRRVLKEESFLRQHESFTSVFYDEDFDDLGLPRPFASDFKFQEPSRLSYVEQMMISDFRNYLSNDLMAKVDRATASVALEGREPFLDHKIVEYAAKLPMSLKYRPNQSKYILRKILHQYVPKDLVDRPKQGFGMPVYIWFKGELKELFRKYLDQERIRKDGIFNPPYVENLLNAYLKNGNVDHYKLWYLFSFQLWREKWFP